MSASGRFKRWLDSKLGKQTDPEPPSEAPTRRVRRLKPVEDNGVEHSSQAWHDAPTRRIGHNYIRKTTTDNIVHICYHNTTKRLNRPTTSRKKKDHILRKDPITRKVTRIDLRDVDGTKTTVVFYDSAGRLIN